MEPMTVVTCEMSEDEKTLFQECLQGVTRFVFLQDVQVQERRYALEKAELVVSQSFSPREIALEEIAFLKKTKFIQLVFSGADDVPFHLIPEHITVANNPGAFSEPIAEHVLAMVLSLAKRLHLKHDLLARGRFDRSGFNTFLKGRTCAIIGVGGNGKAVARLMRALDMTVFGINRSGKTDAPVDRIGTLEDLKEILEASDVVVLTIPLTQRTRGLIGKEALAWMKADAILINVARGAVIDQGALYEHLKKHPDFRAGIDTWWSEPAHHGVFSLDYPFFELPNIVGSPHLADAVPGMSPTAIRLALENVRAYLSGREIRGVLTREDYLS
jgi:phosphoglycerate dehydrogenase-like enzyme